MTVRRMLSYRVYVNDTPQRIAIGGDPVHVSAIRLGFGPDAPHVVQFWAEGSLEEPGTPRTFQVFGTGHPLPPGARWRGTTERTPEGLVWHLYELPDPGES
ncbi:hypothetical protein RM780_07765 [Streptomyces sp. DSM 44917]|uniref:DUF7352 domain-containing protein n=1 Tax=Streptomyces boetiae TaxID=3075541 RepID=A0ABU2L5L5_9ACTN|nr:hypothetical protein [Streptomyces sp. DSM 44917]MDT0306859.1 hypothetical protein [Streptomyces sp. DSM 44917]